MEYKFHKGDYVESRNGSIGYLTDGKIWYSGTVNDDIVCLQGSTTVNVSCGFTPFTITVPLSDISKYFNRIGQYDFTKKDDDKIEPLCEEYTKSFPICKTTTTESGSEWSSVDIGDMGRKINELVNAINELREKANGN